MQKLILILFLIISIKADTIKSIQFKNLYSISDKVALEVLNLEPGDKLDIKKIDNAIKTYFKYDYFEDIWTEFNNGNLIINFKEKPTIGILEIKGYKTREEDLKLLYMGMNLKKGSMYSKKRVQNAKKYLLQELDKEGYIGSVVEVETQKINDNSIKVTFIVNKGYELIATKVNYFGAKKLSKDDFEEVTANKEKEFMGWFIGRNDGVVHLEELPYENMRIKDKYLQYGYLDAKVSPALLKADFNTYEATIDFFIEEGIQYKVSKIDIYVDKKLVDIDKFKEEMNLQIGKKFNIEYLRKDINKLKRLVSDKGYAYAQVIENIQKDSNNTVRVSLKVIPNELVYINDVIISGNTKTLDRVIRRNVYLASGDLYSYTDYIDSLKKLKRSGYFSNVSIKKQRVSKNKMNLLVNVQETNTGSLTLGGGYGSYSGFTINASINDKNIFGSGKTLGFKFEKSDKTKEYKIYLYEPAVYDSKYSATIDLHDTSEERTNTDSTTGIVHTLTTKLKGFGIGVGRNLTRNIYANLFFAHDKTTDEYDDNISLNESYIVETLTPSISFNNTDDYFVPRSGHKATLSYKYAGFNGDSKYAKTYLTYKYYHGFQRTLDYDLIFRYRATAGYLQDLGKVRYSDSFYLGGPKTVRGYQYGAFGPTGDGDTIYNRLFANSVEFSIPLFPKAKMRMSFFYDIGMIGEDGFDLVKKGRGITIEWFTPVGPLQFIFAKAIDPDEYDDTSSFEFTLGQSF